MNFVKISRLNFVVVLLSSCMYGPPKSNALRQVGALRSDASAVQSCVRHPVPTNPGSKGHPIGCRPCNKYKPERPDDSCKHGDDCFFCHGHEHERPKQQGQRGRHARQKRQVMEGYNAPHDWVLCEGAINRAFIKQRWGCYGFIQADLSSLRRAEVAGYPIEFDEFFSRLLVSYNSLCVSDDKISTCFVMMNIAATRRGKAWAEYAKIGNALERCAELFPELKFELARQCQESQENKGNQKKGKIKCWTEWVQGKVVFCVEKIREKYGGNDGNLQRMRWLVKQKIMQYALEGGCDFDVAVKKCREEYLPQLMAKGKHAPNAGEPCNDVDFYTKDIDEFFNNDCNSAVEGSFASKVLDFKVLYDDIMRKVEESYKESHILRSVASIFGTGKPKSEKETLSSVRERLKDLVDCPDDLLEQDLQKIARLMSGIDDPKQTLDHLNAIYFIKKCFEGELSTEDRKKVYKSGVERDETTMKELLESDPED